MFKKKDEAVVAEVAAEETPAEIVVDEALPAEEPVAEPVAAEGRGNEYGDSPQDPPIKAQGHQTIL